ncbi:MAG: hypothetical protein MGF17_13275 [Trichodesmium sp. MAG_R04]|nr:hypothetical protein [Trichodesmium sp. MAG_R04]
MALSKGEIYADREAIAADLAWLEKNGIVAEGQVVDVEILDQEISPLLLTTKNRKNKGTSSLHVLKEEQKEIQLEDENNSDSKIIPHTYSDIFPFKRLMRAIRLILNKPFLRDDHKKSLNLFVDTLSEEQGI